MKAFIHVVHLAIPLENGGKTKLGGVLNREKREKINAEREINAFVLWFSYILKMATKMTPNYCCCFMFLLLHVL